MGLTYGTHICGGHPVLSEFMIGEKHLDCGMAMMDMTDNETGDHFANPDCCKNQYLSSNTDDSFKKSLSLDLSTVFVATTVASIIYSFELFPSRKQPIAVDSSPPFLKRDITVMYKVFRI